MKTKLAVWLMLSLSLITACGSSSSNMEAISSPTAYLEEEDAAESMEFSMDSADAGSMQRIEGSNSTAVQTSDRKLIYHANYQMESKEFDTSLDALLETIEQSGGYIESQNMYGGSFDLEYGDERNISIQARIPSAQYQSVTSQFESIAHIVSHDSSVDDATDRYYDNQSRMDALKVQEQRLLEILTIADTVEDIITIEQKLAEVRYQIESFTSTLQQIDKQVDYSRVTIHLQEVKEYKPEIETFGDRVSNAVDDSWRNVSNLLEGFLIFAISQGPAWLIFASVLGLIIFGVVKIVSKWDGRNRAKNEKKIRAHQVAMSQKKTEQNLEEPEETPTDLYPKK